MELIQWPLRWVSRAVMDLFWTVFVWICPWLVLPWVHLSSPNLMLFSCFLNQMFKMKIPRPVFSGVSLTMIMVICILPLCHNRDMWLCLWTCKIVLLSLLDVSFQPISSQIWRFIHWHSQCCRLKCYAPWRKIGKILLFSCMHLTVKLKWNDWTCLSSNHM